jgi:hypothetical protein
VKKPALLLLFLAFIVISASGYAQVLTWSNDTSVSNVKNVYTANGRPGVTSAFFNNQIWMAYINSSCTPTCAIELTHTAATGTLSFSTPAYVNVSGVGDISSYQTPALTAQNGYLYLAYDDGSNRSWLTSSADGVNWSSPYQLTTAYNTTWAPSLAADALNSSRIYAGFSSASNQTPVICAVYPNPSNMALSTQTCENFSSLNAMNYNPGLIYWNQDSSGVIMAYEWQGNTHCLYGYILNPETGYSFDYNAAQNCSDQTSVAPSLATLPSGSVYLGFGGNNSNRQFNVRYTDPDELDFIYKKTLSQGMNGSPDLLTITPTGYYPELVNFYVWNGQVHYMYGTD